jgi:hypothetical protein
MNDRESSAGVEKLRRYLTANHAEQSLFNRAWLLLSSERMKIMQPAERQALLAELERRQQPDGGWSLQSLGPWKWARADEPFNSPGPLDSELLARSDGYATGLVAAQLGWLALLALPAQRWLAGFAVLAPAELLVPLWAEHRRPTTWHPHHIAERFGLLTLIVLGESVLSATTAIQVAADETALTPALLAVVVGGVLVLFAMWWIYFDEPAHDLLASSRAAFVWGYGHLVIFASIAAVGAGLAVAADYAVGRSHLGGGGVLAVVLVPLGLYVTSVWALVIHPLRRARR